MRNLKRVLSLALASVMLLGMMVIGASAADKTAADLTDSDKITNKEAVNLMVDLGIIVGKPDGSYGPTETVDRATMAKLITYILMGDVDGDTFAGTKTDLKDIDDSWAKGYINYCYANNIIAGDGKGSFFPKDKVTVVQAAKMLLVALGYNAEDKGYQNDPNWSVNIMKDAKTKGLLDGFDANKAQNELTRDNAAQMIYNTLMATTVTAKYDRDMGEKYVSEYENDKTTLGYQTYGLIKVTATVDSISNNKAVLANYTPADAVVKTATNTKLAGTDELVGKKVVFFVKGTLDSTDNKTVTKVDKIISSSLSAASSTVLATVTSGIANMDNATKTSHKDFVAEVKKDDDGKYTVYTYLNGKQYNTPSSAVASLDSAVTTAAADKGVITEFIDADGDGVADIIKVTNKTVRELTGDAATKVVDDTTQVKVPGVLSSFVSNYTTKNVFGYEGLKKGDVVLFYKDEAGNYYFEAAESFDGQLTSNKGNTLTISGSTYDISDLTGAMKLDDIKEQGYNKDVTYWLDNGGNIVRAKAEKADTTTTSALLLGFQKIGGGWGADSYEAMLLFADGTTEVVSVADGSDIWTAVGSANFDAVKAGTYSSRFAKINFVEYSVNNKGDYELTLKGATKEDDTITPKKANFADSNIGNANTVFIVAQYKDNNPAKEITGYKTYTGINNVPTITSADYYSYADKSGIAKLVFVTAGSAQGAEKDFAYILSTAEDDVGYTPANGDVAAYYTYDAVIEGVNVTLKVAKNNLFSGKGLYEVVYTDGVVTSINGVVKTMAETKIDNVGGGVIKVGGTSYTFVEDAMAYIVDGKDGSSVPVADLENDSNDLVFVEEKDASTIKNLYIVKVADAAMPTELVLTATGSTPSTIDLLTSDKVINVGKDTTKLEVTTKTPATGTTVTYKIDNGSEDAAKDGITTSTSVQEFKLVVTVKNSAAPYGTLELTYTIKVAATPAP